MLLGASPHHQSNNADGSIVCQIVLHLGTLPAILLLYLALTSKMSLDPAAMRSCAGMVGPPKKGAD